MANLNKVFLIGNLAQDPELRYTPSGVAVSDLRLATSRVWTGKDGERREDTLFIDVTVWNRQAENCCQFLRKGRLIHVEGFLKSESWENAAGEKRTKIKVEAERVQFLDRRDDGTGGSGGGYGSSAFQDDDTAMPSQSRGRDGAARAYTPSDAPRRPSTPPPESAEDEEDIPF